MILLRQKIYSKTSKIIKGALITAPAGLVAGTIVGDKMGRKKATNEEKKEVAKKKIEENKKKIKANKEAYPIYKERARKEREERGPESSWDDLDRVEIEMADDLWRDIPRENKKLKEENKKLESGNYESLLADDTPTGKKYVRGGAILGTAAGAGTGALLGYGLHKLAKKLKK